MSSVSTLSTAQIEKAFRTTPPKTKSKRAVEDFVYDPAYDELLEAENFNRRVTELEDEGQMPSYLRYLRSALCLVIHDSPCDEDIPLLKGVALYTNSDTLRQQALSSLQSYLLDCSGNRDARLKPAVQQLLQTFEKDPMDPNTSTPPNPSLDDEALRWKLINFMPRRLVGNDSQLEAFLTGAVDFTKPSATEEQE